MTYHTLFKPLIYSLTSIQHLMTAYYKRFAHIKKKVFIIYRTSYTGFYKNYTISTIIIKCSTFIFSWIYLISFIVYVCFGKIRLASPTLSSLSDLQVNLRITGSIICIGKKVKHLIFINLNNYWTEKSVPNSIASHIFAYLFLNIAIWYTNVILAFIKKNPIPCKLAFVQNIIQGAFITNYQCFYVVYTILIIADILSIQATELSGTLAWWHIICCTIWYI